MKKLVCILLFALLISYHFRAQPKFYFNSCEKADSLYQAGEYLQSAYIYQLAFEYFRGKAHENDRYNAARSWASGNEPDSALRHLEHRAGLPEQRVRLFDRHGWKGRLRGFGHRLPPALGGKGAACVIFMCGL